MLLNRVTGVIETFLSAVLALVLVQLAIEEKLGLDDGRFARLELKGGLGVNRVPDRHPFLEFKLLQLLLLQLLQVLLLGLPQLNLLILIYLPAQKALNIAIGPFYHGSFVGWLLGEMLLARGGSHDFGGLHEALPQRLPVFHPLMPSLILKDALVGLLVGLILDSLI